MLKHSQGRRISDRGIHRVNFLFIFIALKCILLVNTFSLLNRPDKRRTSPLYLISSPSSSSNSTILPPSATPTNIINKTNPLSIKSTINTLKRRVIRNRTLSFAKNVARPGAIAMVLKDAAEGAVDEILNTQQLPLVNRKDASSLAESRKKTSKAFDMVEDALQETEKALLKLQKAKAALEQAKIEAINAISNAEAISSISQDALVVLPNDVDEDEDTATATIFEELDFTYSEMAAPYLNEDQCLVPGEPVIRIEKASEKNSRQIFAGVDISADADTIWNCLTDYENLDKVVPNLVLNEVLEYYNATEEEAVTESMTEEEKCEILSKSKKGCKLRQVGGAKLVGINFSAKTTLEVREWPHGLPNSFSSPIAELRRNHFPRPFALSTLPTRDISMQSAVDVSDQDFRLYQGVWRMQTLPGCAPPGKSATRLTYAVEIFPKSYLPIKLVEGRIVKDLCNNLEAIRDFVTD